MPTRRTPISGVVASFDEHAGHGTVVGDADDARHFFHCTRIADGSRTIAVGEHVTYRVEPLGFGSWEAVDVRPRSAV